jgi:hypothetical protein
MWRLRHVFVLAAVTGAGAVLSACGGDSSPETPIVVQTTTSSTSATGLSKAEFIAQADSTCSEANAAIQQFADAGQGVTEADQIAQLRQGVIDKINQLGPPTEDKTTLDQFITAMQAQVAAGQKIGLATDRGEDTAQFETELDTAKSDAATAAGTYGFSECGSSITSSGTSTSSSSASSSGYGTATAPSAPSTSAGSTGSAGGTSGGSTGSGTSGGGSTGGGTGGSSGSGGIGPG